MKPMGKQGTVAGETSCALEDMHRDCFACGVSNPVGLNLHFVVGEDGIAVLGVDADEIIGYSSLLGLSSVDTLPITVGGKAAEIMEEWMKGRPPPPGCAVLGDPGEVVCRQSTDGFATRGLAVQRAVHFLRNTHSGKVDFF